MAADKILNTIKNRFDKVIYRTDIPAENRLILFVEPGSVKELCRFVFRDLDARYCITIGMDDRPYSGDFIVSHDFAFDRANLLVSILVHVASGDPSVDCISDVVPAASWAEREMYDLLGIRSVGMPSAKRLILPDGWPENAHPLRKDVPWNFVPPGYDEKKTYPFDPTPANCTVVPLGPFHPALDEPEHFRLFVEGEVVRGLEYRGFMVHRGIEKLADSVMTYDEIPMLAERICGICGCVHSVAYVQAVEQAIALVPAVRAEFIRTVMLELERLHSHLLWIGLASHIVGFDTMFMQCFRIREPVMWIAEKITGNRKMYALCVVGGVRWDITPELGTELKRVLETLEKEWLAVVNALKSDRNVQARTRGVGIADRRLVKEMGLLGPVARASGMNIDARRDLPYAAYSRVEFDVVVEQDGDVWSRILVRALEVFESIRIIRQCLERMPIGPLRIGTTGEIPPGRIGVSSVEAPRGESHHFVVTGEENRPRRWRVRAPTYQNLQGIPEMARDQRIADIAIIIGSIDPCFSCTDRVEIVDLVSGGIRPSTLEELRPGSSGGGRR